jgi:tetratricopeptide (TPR) repeat protein
MPQVPQQERSATPTELDQSGVAQHRIATRNESACFLPPLNSVSKATVGIIDLEVPSKPHSEFESGCVALHKNKIADAEKHLRKAIREYEKYAAAWVLLGQLLETEQKPEEARAACIASLNASVTYVPGYLCLSDISVRQKNWDDALKFSARVLELDPTNNAVAYAYHATANLRLHRLLEAEKNALKALEIDVRNTEPRIHFLMAQIYAAKGDRQNTAAQLREYLKYAKDPGDIALVQGSLAKIEGVAPK